MQNFIKKNGQDSSKTQGLPKLCLFFPIFFHISKLSKKTKQIITSNTTDPLIPQ